MYGNARTHQICVWADLAMLTNDNVSALVLDPLLSTHSAQGLTAFHTAPMEPMLILIQEPDFV